MIQYVINQVSIWAIPVFLLVIPLYGAVRGVKVYESFVEGAKEGFQVGVRCQHIAIRGLGVADSSLTRQPAGPRHRALARCVGKQIVRRGGPHEAGRYACLGGWLAGPIHH